MIESTVEVPFLQIGHDKTVNFKRVFECLNADETSKDIAAIVPIFEISKAGIVILTISGPDIEKTVNSEIVVTKELSFFEDFDCLLDYQYRLYDQVTTSVFVKGIFKIL